MYPPNAAPPPDALSMPSQPGASQIDQALLQRFRTLTPHEHDALEAVSPEAAAVIVKLVPELRAVIQMVLDEEGGSEGSDDETGGVSYGAEAEQEMAGMEDDAEGPLPPQRSRTALGRM